MLKAEAESHICDTACGGLALVADFTTTSSSDKNQGDLHKAKSSSNIGEYRAEPAAGPDGDDNRAEYVPKSDRAEATSETGSKTCSSIISTSSWAACDIDAKVEQLQMSMCVLSFDNACIRNHKYIDIDAFCEDVVWRHRTRKQCNKYVRELHYKLFAQGSLDRPPSCDSGDDEKVPVGIDGRPLSPSRWAAA